MEEKKMRIVTESLDGVTVLPQGGFVTSPSYPWAKVSASFTITEEYAIDYERKTGFTMEQHVDGANALCTAIVKGELG